MEQPHPQQQQPQKQQQQQQEAPGGTSPETVSKSRSVSREDESAAAAAAATTPGPKKDREEWSEGAISTLIDAYSAKYGELNGKGLRSKDWAEVVATVNSKIQNSTKTVEHCRNKMDTLTKRYKSERKNRLSGTDCTWPWYEKMEIIRGCSPSKGTKLLPLGSPPDRGSRAKRGKKMPTLEDLSALASDQFVQRHDKNKSAGASKSATELGASKASGDASFGSQSPSFLNFQTIAAVAAAAAQATNAPPVNAQNQPPPTNPTVRGINEQNGSQEQNYLAKSIADLASSMRAMAGSLASSITGFAEVYAKVEISKMEIFKDLELKRTQMQLDSQVKIATILSRGNSKRKRENSSDSE